MIEDFRPFVPDDELARLGSLIEQFPKSKWDRGALSQLGMAVVGAGLCAVFLAVSFTVDVSDKPEEQLPFQQAMWGFAVVGAIIGLYGLFTGLWRWIVGVAHVGRWWLLFERGLVIVNNGKLQHCNALSELRVQTPTSLTAKPRLVDEAGRSLPLPVGIEENLIQAVQFQQRKRRGIVNLPRERVPYALAWAEGKLFGEDRVFRLYADGQSVLLIYAGQFVAEKLGAKMGMILPVGTIGVAAIAAQAYGNWIASRDYDKRAAYLDAMTIEELREEAANNRASAVLTLAATSAIHLGPAVTRFWSSDYLQSQVKGRLAFQHHRKTWELAFFTVEELSHALHALTTAFGHERLTVQL